MIRIQFLYHKYYNSNYIHRVHQHRQQPFQHQPCAMKKLIIQQPLAIEKDALFLTLRLKVGLEIINFQLQYFNIVDVKGDII